MEPSMSDDLGKELEDAFATMLRGLSSAQTVEIELEPRSEVPIIIPDELINTLATSALPDNIGGLDPGELQPPHHNAATQTPLLEDIRQQISSNNLNGVVESLSGLFSGMMNLIPSVPQHQLPIAALPDYIEQRRDDVSTAGSGGLLNAKDYATTGMQNLTEYVTRMFRVLDLAQEDLQHTLASATIPPTLPTGAASASSSSMPGPAPPSSLAVALAAAGSFMSKISESNFTKEMSSAIQSNPVYLHGIAAELAQKLQDTPEESPDYRVLQSGFGLTHLHLYKLTYDVHDLDAGVGATSAAVWMPDDGTFPPATTLLVHNWVYGQRLLARREQSHDMLERAVDIGRRTLSISIEYYPNDRPGRRLLTMELAECLLDHYHATGLVSDLNDALESIRTAFKVEEMEETRSQCVLAELYLERFRAQGELADIDMALYYAVQQQHFHSEHDPSVSRPAALLTDGPVPLDAARGLHVLAMALAQRFTVVSDIGDFDKAVAYGRTAVALCPETSPLLSIYLTDLATLLHDKYVADNSLGDLDDSIVLLRRAVSLRCPGAYTQYPPRAMLGLVLARHGECTMDVGEIDDGIAHLIAARKETPTTHLEARMQHDLADAYLLRHQRSQSPDDLDEAIRHVSGALDNTPEYDGRARSARALRLGDMLAARFSRSRADADFEKGLETLRCVATGAGQPSVRMQAALRWEQLASERGPEASLEALKAALDVFPLLAWAGNRMVVQYRALVSWAADVGPRAAAHAITCGLLQDAVAYLERGRNVLWAQTLQFQPGMRRHRATMQPVSAAGSTTGSAVTTEADSLSSYLSTTGHGFPQITDEHKAEVARTNPALSTMLENLTSIRDELVRAQRAHPNYRPEHDEQMDSFKRMFMGMYEDASLHGAAKRWKSLKESAKSLAADGVAFGSFKDDPRLVDLLAKGHIVFLNASIRVDALILRRAPDGQVNISHVPLPNLSMHDVTSWAESIQTGMGDLSEEGLMSVRDFDQVILLPILRDLWRTTAAPVLAHLLIDSASSTANPPRIWWCPTGPLAFLPIHAAGPYEDGRPGVPDLVVSSYISTLQSLLRSHSAPSAPLSMLAVGLPETPNLSPLPAVQKELATVQRACARLAHTPTCLVGPAATPLAVSRALAQHSWLHLSCHAYQDPACAFDSAFCMHGGALTLGALMQLDLARVQFAFLSACLTSAGDARLPDECIHLAAGMQFAGVRSAVATLWAVDDRAAAFVTERVYGQLMRDGVGNPDPREAAEALHAAVGALKTAGRPMVFWVPFIHVGL